MKYAIIFYVNTFSIFLFVDKYLCITYGLHFCNSKFTMFKGVTLCFWVEFSVLIDTTLR